jgi:sodium transport system ATP-binding protein
MTATVQARDLTKLFYDEGRGEVRAVNRVSFECYPGEILGLLGANGAGKTTTLRMLATILRPSSGSASVMGCEVSSDPEGVRRSLGFSSATTALYPRLTARETLRFFARINGWPRTDLDRRVNELIEKFGLTGFADARVDRLSQGMKQKVAIARTVAHDPPVLIFDEPTVGLDVLNAIEMLKVIGQLREDGKTIIFSTHIMSEAEKLCDRIAIMNAGTIHMCDTLAALRAATGLHYLEDIFVRCVTGHAKGAGANA